MSRSVKPIDNVVVLTGNKLIGIDTILPVVMQLKHERPQISITFLLLNSAWQEAIERNYVIARGIESIGTIRILARTPRNLFTRTQSAINLAAIAVSMKRRPTLLLSPGDLAPFPFNIMAWSTRSGGGRPLIHCKPAYPGSPAFNYAGEIKSPVPEPGFRDSGDAFVIYHPDQANDYSRYTSAAPIVVGTPRLMPAWRAHLDAIAVQGIRDDLGNDLRSCPKPIFVIFYCGPAEIPIQIDDVRTSFLGIIDILADEAPNATIVVKPHPICDLGLLRQDIARSRRPDIVISHAHPQLLARIAAVAICPNGSNVMNDMYVERVPVIETTRYCDDILARGESLFPNVGRIDATDEIKLRQAIARAADDARALPRPDPCHISWPSSQSVGDLLLGAP